MQAFATLYAAIDASTSTQDKVAAMRTYFGHASARDAAWAAYFLAGGKPRQTVPTAVLRALACRMAGIEDWLFDECYQAVGDLAETIALLLPPGVPAGADAVANIGSDPDALGLADWIETRLLPLRGQPPAEQAERVAAYWGVLDLRGRFLLNQLIGGGFRVGVSKLLVQRALGEVAGVDAKQIAERMMGYTDAKTLPTAARFAALLVGVDASQTDDVDGVATAPSGQPYPFFLAHALDGDPAGFAERIGPPADWLIDWKYDGIRAQIVKRGGQVWLWSRGEELITERFPEVVAQAEGLADGCVLDGELMVWQDERPAAFAKLQQRIGRKTLSARLLAEVPVVFMAYDLLEWHGADQRGHAQQARRTVLEQAVAGTALQLSPLVEAADWLALAEMRRSSRERGVEGLMLKQRDSPYGSGRTKSTGVWWKWKIEPMTADAVLVYAQRGHGRRASVYTDYTFAVWSRAPRDAAEAQAVVDHIAAGRPAEPGGLQLVTFAKAYSGLTDVEFAEVDRVIRATTREKFGPVRSVVPSLVFELGFEGLQQSPRHKSGIAVRFPRMLRIRHDKPLHEADTLDTLKGLIEASR
ncbi:MAG: ATP-dependent DNA ligase [Burkholderiaceae bacterium]